MKNHKFRQVSVKLYHHLVARNKLEVGKKYNVFRACFITLLNRKIGLFAANTDSKDLKYMLEDINTYGKLKINIATREKDYILFTVSRQEFKPIDWTWQTF